MRRRRFLLKAYGSLLSVGLAVSGCATTTLPGDNDQHADKRHTIDAGVDSTLARLYRAANGSRALVEKARAVLIFPSVTNTGFGTGSQSGKGSLQVGGHTLGYYSAVADSMGLLIDTRAKAIVFLFMSEDSLQRFLGGKSWEVGRDASVTVLSIDADGDFNTDTATGQVSAFVLQDDRETAGAPLDGTRITRIESL